MIRLMRSNVLTQPSWLAFGSVLLLLGSAASVVLTRLLRGLLWLADVRGLRSGQRLPKAMPTAAILLGERACADSAAALSADRAAFVPLKAPAGLLLGLEVGLNRSNRLLQQLQIHARFWLGIISN
jgi:hypothetical protein